MEDFLREFVSHGLDLQILVALFAFLAGYLPTKNREKDDDPNQDMARVVAFPFIVAVPALAMWLWGTYSVSVWPLYALTFLAGLLMFLSLHFSVKYKSPGRATVGFLLVVLILSLTSRHYNAHGQKSTEVVSGKASSTKAKK